MRIGETNTPVRTSPARTRAPGRGFVVPDGHETAESSACEGAVQSAPIVSVSLCADWEGGDRPVTDREARRHGQAMLDALASLQLAQLTGDPRASLDGLAQLAAQTPSVSDPGLQAVLQAIAARAAVELARVT